MSDAFDLLMERGFDGAVGVKGGLGASVSVEESLTLGHP